jgi:hypothetical protein
MYVGTGQRAGMGRLARAHRLSSLGRLRGAARRLGQDDYATPDEIASQFTGSQVVPGQTPGVPSGNFSSPVLSTADSFYGSGSLLPAGSSGSSGFTAAQEAALLSQGISTAGVLGKQAIIGSPSLTYNPATGQYVATGGATLPTGLSLSSLFTGSTGTLLLLAIAGVVAFMVLKK